MIISRVYNVIIILIHLSFNEIKLIQIKRDHLLNECRMFAQRQVALPTRERSVA